MLSWEEIGHGLGGRSKSVIILTLAALLTAQQGYIHERGLMPAGVDHVEHSNPIDMCFGGYSGLNLTPDQERTYAQIYLSCWEKELENAYSVLAGRDCFPGTENYAEKASRNFTAFAEAESWLEAYCQKEDAQEELATGKACLQGQLYRQQVLRIYSELGLTAEEQYIFDQKETEKVLKEFCIKLK